MTEDFSDDLFSIESDALANLDRVLGQQEIFLREKSKVRWLAEGIKISTSFTHCLNAKGGRCLFPPCKLLILLSTTLVGLVSILFPMISTFSQIWVMAVWTFRLFESIFLASSLHRRMLPSSVFLLKIR